MREIEYYEIGKFDPDKGKCPRIKLGDALFHQWGTDYLEFETGAGNFSTAIIELENGEVLNIDTTLIKFKLPPNPSSHEIAARMEKDEN